MKQKVIIQGANDFAKRLKMRIDSIFEILAFIDRDKRITETAFDGVPIFTDYSKILNFEYDYIFTTALNVCGVHREFNNLYDVPHEKMISMRSVHQIGKHITFAAFANEISFRNIPGAIAEVGVDFGDTASYLNLFFPNRTLYLFDTFSGFDKRDVEFEKSKKTMISKYENTYNERSNAQDVMNRMFYKEHCIIKQGVFPESLEGLEDTFAFVHIDCDLQKPIEAALEYFYPRLQNGGGVICVHDYFNHRYTGVRAVVREFAFRYKIVYTPIALYNGVAICK